MRTVLNSAYWVVVGASLWFAIGCGVKQYNTELPEETAPTKRYTKMFGPFWAAGQEGHALSAPTCRSGSGRPCIRARASVGLPYHFDTNTIDGVSATNDGSPPTPGTNYTTVAGAGKTQSPSGGGRLENKDLHTIQKQPGAAPYSF